MSKLEAEYRSALRWYTAKWRRHNGEALVATLLDAAEASGRDNPSRPELRNLRSSGLRQRAFAALPFALFAVSLFAALVVGSLALANVDPSSGLILHLPALPAPRIGDLYTVPSVGPFPAGWAYAVGATIFALSLAVGVVTLRRNRRLLSITR